jgi:hypothetical protein
LFSGVTGCGESLLVSMIVAIARAYRSEPPPGAVLMTNSTGCVGWTAAADADVDALGPGALAVAQADRVTRAAARIAADRITGLDMRRTSMEQVRTAVSKGSHRRSDHG